MRCLIKMTYPQKRKMERKYKMTNDGAEKIKSTFSNGIWFSFGNGEFDDPSFDTKGAKKHADLLNEVIEKQIPKKPVMVDEQRPYLAARYECPICNGVFTGTGIANYCHHCGQALNWDDFI